MCLIPPAAFSSTPKSASHGKENYPPRFSIPAVAFSGCSGITILGSNQTVMIEVM